MVQYHDWRYRIETILNTFNLEMNPLLKEELSQLFYLQNNITILKTKPL